MKRKNTTWRNSFGKEVTAVNDARKAFAAETNTIIQRLVRPDPNHMKPILTAYKASQTAYKKILVKTNGIVKKYYDLRNAFIDILMGDRTNCDLFKKAEKETETIQFL